MRSPIRHNIPSRGGCTRRKISTSVREQRSSARGRFSPPLAVENCRRPPSRDGWIHPPGVDRAHVSRWRSWRSNRRLRAGDRRLSGVSHADVHEARDGNNAWRPFHRTGCRYPSFPPQTVGSGSGSSASALQPPPLAPIFDNRRRIVLLSTYSLPSLCFDHRSTPRASVHAVPRRYRTFRESPSVRRVTGSTTALRSGNRECGIVPFGRWGDGTSFYRPV
ncbi:hypothetical protein SAMN04489841_4056 [Natrinema salaciae]|uniref:Uncharacterized protein n=1 Tax=Natrinema salaciae TaxID=1186196 RepID=A0A1H9Q2K6_9EURY|nr:hypothetical protein SAMN04489841_4056 [Natrinema salaciae]